MDLHSLSRIVWEMENTLLEWKSYSTFGNILMI